MQHLYSSKCFFKDFKVKLCFLGTLKDSQIFKSNLTFSGWPDVVKKVKKWVLKCHLSWMFPGKRLDCRPVCLAVDLRQLCHSLRHRAQCASEIPDSAFDLLLRLLDLNPFSRVTAADALNHMFIADDE